MPQYEMSRNGVENAGLPAVFGDLYRESKFAVRLWLSGFAAKLRSDAVLTAGRGATSEHCLRKFFSRNM
jgi:hypothetical protein